MWEQVKRLARPSAHRVPRTRRRCLIDLRVRNASRAGPRWLSLQALQGRPEPESFDQMMRVAMGFEPRPAARKARVLLP